MGEGDDGVEEVPHTSPSCSRQSPPASSTSPQSPPGLPSPSSASWPSSASSPPSAPSSSSCPAFTGCTCEASLWLIPQTGGFASPGPTRLGTSIETTTTTVIEFILKCIEPQKYCVCVMKYI